jgi:hypothetical protein
MDIFDTLLPIRITDGETSMVCPASAPIYSCRAAAVADLPISAIDFKRLAHVIHSIPISGKVHRALINKVSYSSKTIRTTVLFGTIDEFSSPRQGLNQFRFYYYY